MVQVPTPRQLEDWRSVDRRSRDVGQLDHAQRYGPHRRSEFSASLGSCELLCGSLREWSRWEDLQGEGRADNLGKMEEMRIVGSSHLVGVRRCRFGALDIACVAQISRSDDSEILR